MPNYAPLLGGYGGAGAGVSGNRKQQRYYNPRNPYEPPHGGGGGGQYGYGGEDYNVVPIDFNPTPFDDGGGGGNGGQKWLWDMYTEMEGGWNQPKWFGGSPLNEKQWTDWGSKDAYGNVKQQWYRDSDWGGHVVWHPFYGWQAWEEVVPLYEQAEGPVSWQQFKEFPLEKQISADWRDFYADRAKGGGGGGGTGGGGDVTTEDYTSTLLDPYDWYQAPNSVLQNYGWTGPIGFNPMELGGLDYINEMYQTQGPLMTMMPAQGYYNQALSGEFSPQGQMYRDQVYDATKNQVMQDLLEQQKLMSENFSHRGGYFGGQHAMAQGKMGADTMSNLTRQLADLNMQGWNQDMATRAAAAEGLQGLGMNQMNVSNSILNQMLTGGNMITQRDALNRAELQGALGRAYDDWGRARQEQMMPFNMILSLLDKQPYQPIVQQQQPSPWNALLGGFGQGFGKGLGSWMTGGMGG